MKFLYDCFLLLALIVPSQAYSEQWGCKGTGDILLHRHLQKNPSKYNHIWDINVTYPNALVNSHTISTIIVTDNLLGSYGATPSMRSGGVGYRYAQVNLRNSRGIDSTVEIWGRS